MLVILSYHNYYNSHHAITEGELPESAYSRFLNRWRADNLMLLAKRYFLDEKVNQEGNHHGKQGEQEYL